MVRRCITDRTATGSRYYSSMVLEEAVQIGDRAAAVVAAVPASAYLSMSRALEQWEAPDGLDRLRSRTLIIAAEHDQTPLAEKYALAARLGASMVVVHGSRHGTPFDSSEATNSSLLALLTDQSLLPYERLVCDTPTRAQAEFLNIRSRVLELLDNAADSRSSESFENGRLKAAPWRSAMGKRRPL